MPPDELDRRHHSWPIRGRRGRSPRGDRHRRRPSRQLRPVGRLGGRDRGPAARRRAGGRARGHLGGGSGDGAGHHARNGAERSCLRAARPGRPGRATAIHSRGQPPARNRGGRGPCGPGPQRRRRSPARARDRRRTARVTGPATTVAGRARQHALRALHVGLPGAAQGRQANASQSALLRRLLCDNAGHPAGGSALAALHAQLQRREHGHLRRPAQGCHALPARPPARGRARALRVAHRPPDHDPSHGADRAPRIDPLGGPGALLPRSAGHRSRGRDVVRRGRPPRVVSHPSGMPGRESPRRDGTQCHRPARDPGRRTAAPRDGARGPQSAGGRARDPHRRRPPRRSRRSRTNRHRERPSQPRLLAPAGSRRGVRRRAATAGLETVSHRRSGLHRRARRAALPGPRGHACEAQRADDRSARGRGRAARLRRRQRGGRRRRR